MKENIPTNDLFDFMRTATNEMQDEYERIQKRAKEDAGTAGDEGEENWASLFKDWLPPTYQIVTKGRILSHIGKAGPQVDVIVLKPSYPRKLLDKKTYFAGGVAAAFECKLTLKAEHFQKVFENASSIKKLALPRRGTPYRELHSPIIYGLLAHSHNWKSDPITIVGEHLKKQDSLTTKHPCEMLDVICVADLATWVSMKKIYREIETWYSLFAPQPHNEQSKNLMEQKPIGSMITYLLLKLAWEDTTIQDIARYFYSSNIAGPGLGVPRRWSESVFTEKTAEKIKLLNAEFQNDDFQKESELLLGYEGREFWNEHGAVYP